jgi:hypothetical protein
MQYSLDGSYLKSLFPVFVELKNSWLNPRSGEYGMEIPPSAGRRQFPALLSAPAVEPRVHINDQQTNFQFGNLRIINENN